MLPRPTRAAWAALPLLALALLLLSLPAQESTGGKDDRRGRFTPGLVLETGARTAACDELLFTRDGSTLLAAGDDKVVREWLVGANEFTEHHSKSLRWPIYREQRGGIFALALSPGQKWVAVGGFGLKTGLVRVINRTTGEPVATMTTPLSDEVTWKVAFAPDSSKVVLGSDRGGIFVWDLKKTTPDEWVPDTEGTDRIRLLAFRSADKGETRFLSVAQSGKVIEHDLDNRKHHRTLGSFRDGLPAPRSFTVRSAALSPDGLTVAAALDFGGGVVGNAAAVRRAQRSVHLLSLRGRPARTIPVPQPSTGDIHTLYSVAFDTEGKRVAVGARVGPKTEGVPVKEWFDRDVGGKVYVFDLAETSKPAATLDVGYRPEALAFRPGKDQLATAGGNNHEVRLWDIESGKLLDTIQSPGTCLWDVGLSKDGRYLGFKQERKPDPSGPGDWGAGPWRVLDLEGEVRAAAPPPPGAKVRLARQVPEAGLKVPRFLPPDQAASFMPVRPRLTLPAEGGGEWKVEATEDAFLWNVVDPEGNKIPLDKAHGYDRHTNQVPRCYTFLRPRAGKTVRLVVGHMWGASVFDCRPGEVNLARLLIGHEGEVMAVGPSADGRVLVTASRDQTACAWTLEDWPASPEFGARFVDEKGKVVVRKVETGSPAWELGLEEGDEVQVVAIKDAEFLYNATRWSLKDLGLRLKVTNRGNVAATVKELNNPRPGREMVFYWTHTEKGAKPEMKGEKTTVKQRPLWRLFPLRAKPEYVVWRWRDFYYDSNSATAASYLGWHLNTGQGGVTGKPEFYPLEQFREKFNRFDKVWATVRGTPTQPEKVIFADIEPPVVKLELVRPADANLKDQDLKVRVTAKPQTPAANMQISRVSLWLDDYRFPDLPALDPKTGALEVVVTIPQRMLRHGTNNLTLQAANKEGGRALAARSVNFESRDRPKKAALRALVCGVNDYTKVRGYNFDDLTCSENDAQAFARLLQAQKDSTLYGADIQVKPLLGKAVTPQAVLDYLKAVKAEKKLGRDDWLVVYLSGHGHAEKDRKSGDWQADSFFYVCPGTNSNNPKSKLLGRDLADALADIRCHKLIILDACHSGSVARDPVQSMTSDGIHKLIFSACRPEQAANEPAEEKYGKHGLFTQALLEAFDGVVVKPAARSKAVTADEAARYVGSRLPALLQALGVGENKQVPVFFPEPIKGLPLLCKP